ncbi:hypothetical protein GCM10020258_07800 [Sphingomonas yabuuchiae]
MTIVRPIAKGLALILILIDLAATIVPHYLDRLYYEGPESGHYDGERFFNPDGDADTMRMPTRGGRGGFLWRQLTGDDGRPAWPETVAVQPSAPRRVSRGSAWSRPGSAMRPYWSRPRG